MTRLIIVGMAAFAACCSICAHAHTEAETNEVVAAMVDALKWNDTGPCCPDEYEEGSLANDDDYISMEALFNQEFGAGWTSNELNVAFDNYLDGLCGVTNLEGIPFERGRVALECCAYRQYPKVYSVVRELAQNPNSPLKAQAWDVIADAAVPSLELNSFVLSAMTNQTLVSSGMKLAFYRAYIPKLDKAYDAGDVVASTNGACVLHAAADCFTAIRPLDELLVKSYPSYATSSNRLAFAELFLSNPTESVSCWSGYYTGVTNQLHSLPQPLSEVHDLQ